jgi:hypothetical protein
VSSKASIRGSSAGYLLRRQSGASTDRPSSTIRQNNLHQALRQKDTADCRRPVERSRATVLRRAQGQCPARAQQPRHCVLRQPRTASPSEERSTAQSVNCRNSMSGSSTTTKRRPHQGRWCFGKTPMRCSLTQSQLPRQLSRHQLSDRVVAFTHQPKHKIGSPHPLECTLDPSSSCARALLDGRQQRAIVIADKAYDADHIRTLIRECHIGGEQLFSTMSRLRRVR